MLEQQNISINKNEDATISQLKLLEELDSEVKMLNEEILNLQSIEKTLMTKIEEEIENKRKARDNLRKQVEELRIKCDELTKIFNSFVQTDM
ncbi:MAG: hypothetical protein QW674_03350 [Candidatus Bathyarchaeia archaeon]